MQISEETIIANYTRATGSVTIEKRDQNNNMLSGAQLKIEACTGQNGDVDAFKSPIIFTSGTTAYATTLNSGYYKLSETAPPTDYVAAAPIVFRIKDDGTV